MSEQVDHADSGRQRVPTLFQYAQRVAALHVDAIVSFNNVPHALVKPILQNCTAQQLAHFEEESPQLSGCSPELWKLFCLNRFPVWGKRFQDGEENAPGDWKEHFQALDHEQTRRMEELSSKLRNERLEAERLQRGKDDIICDQLPTAKRPRWGFQPAPKTLFQKTLTEASRAKPPSKPRPVTINRLVPNASATRMPILPSGNSSPAVSVTTTVQIVKRPAVSRREIAPGSASVSASASASRQSVSTASASSLSSRSAPLSPPLAQRDISMRTLADSSSAPSVCPLIADRPMALNEPGAGDSATISTRPTKPLPRASPSTSRFSPPVPTTDVRPPGKPKVKKDPLAGLFIPKHRTLRPTPIATGSR